jgi:hypothetical protein
MEKKDISFCMCICTSRTCELIKFRVAIGVVEQFVPVELVTEQLLSFLARLIG